MNNFIFLKGAITYHPTTNTKLEYLLRPDAVCITIFNQNLTKVLLVEQYRPGTNSNTFEIPAGLIEKNEDPKVAVLRELAEETGYTSNDLENFCEMKNPLPETPGYSTMKLYFYGAKLKDDNIKAGETNFDEGEDIKSHWINIDEIENYNIDMKTLLGVKYFKEILK